VSGCARTMHDASWSSTPSTAVASTQHGSAQAAVGQVGGHTRPEGKACARRAHRTDWDAWRVLRSVVVAFPSPLAPASMLLSPLHLLAPHELTARHSCPTRTHRSRPAGWAKWVARTVGGGRCPPAMNTSGAATHQKRDKSLASRFWTAAVGTIRVTAAGPACAGCRLRRDARCDAARRPPRRDPLAVARKMWRLHPHGCPGPPGGAPRRPRGAAWRPWTAVRMRAGRPWPGAARPRAWHMRAHARWRARWRAARVPALTPRCAGQIPLLDTARRRTT